MKSTKISLTIAALALTCPLATLAGQKSTPPYRYAYFPVPQVEPGSTLYAFWRGSSVPMAKDIFAFDAWRQASEAGDQQGMVELDETGRTIQIPNETAVRILEFHDFRVLGKRRCYEVRVQAGPFAGKKGWIDASLLCARRPVKVYENRGSRISRLKRDATKP